MTVPYTLIESRQISGLGTIRVPSSPNGVGARVDLLIFDLIRPSVNRYRNFNWFPPRERIANLTFRRSGIVLKHETVEFERQGFWEYPDPGGQALAAVQCSYKGILQTFFNLGNALGLPSISVQNDIKEWARFETPFDEIVVFCYADTAIAASLYQLDYEACGTDSGNFQFPENLPPAPAQTVPGLPTTISPPYDENDPNEPYSPSSVDIEVPGNWEVRISYDAIPVPGTPSENLPLPRQTYVISVPDANWVGQAQQTSAQFGSCPSVQQWELSAQSTTSTGELGLVASDTCHDLQNFTTETVNNI